jgi:hypothetical protein
MSVDPFTIYNNTGELISMAGQVTGNGKFTVRTTASQNNNTARDSILVDVSFSDFILNGGTSPGWSVRCVLESSDGNGNWHRVGAMFEPLRSIEQGARNLVVVQPNIINFDEGIPIDEWDGQAVAYRIHRQQGVLGQDYRFRFEVIETKFATPDALVSFKVKLFGQRYSHAG